ncbi:MAG: carboxypeptidase regulatory-like domain-containing protein, partial [Chitinophagales bacterium]
NAWFSDDSKVVFTTDEKNGAFVVSYDVSDWSDIRELDRYQSSPGENTMPHNVHVHNDFLVISYYNDGVVVVDAHEPDALVETEFFDTSLHSGAGSRGCWGAYPFLPSGNILATDREQGLFVLRPKYERAAYIEGNITETSTGEKIEGVEITIEGKEGVEQSDFGGHYKTGVAQEGLYSVHFYKYGYESLTMENVSLETAKITSLDVQLQARASFDLTVEVVDQATGEAIEGMQIELIIPEISYNQLSDEQGRMEVSPFYADTYNVLAYKWGWVTIVEEMSIEASGQLLRLELQKSYHDDFWLNFGWAVNMIGDMTGVWKRDIPKGTFLEDGRACNPDTDAEGDFGNYCFVTGSSGGELEDNDVEGGTTVLTSPNLDLTDYTYPVLSFQQWFCSSEPTDNNTDFVKFELMNGIDTVELQTIFTNYEIQNAWQEVSFNVLDYLPLTNNMDLVITAKASTSDVVIEAAIDAFRVIDSEPTDIENPTLESPTSLQIFPNPFDGQTTILMETFNTDSSTTTPLQIFDSMGRLVLERDFLGQSQNQDSVIRFDWEADVEAGLYVVKFGGLIRKVIRY